MKQFISPYQFMLLIANFIFAASLITLPQVLTQISDQIAWITPLIVLPIIVAVVLVGFGKGNKAQISQSPKEVTFTHHAYYFLIGIFLITIYIRDLRALVDFTSRALLQTTPIEVIAILITIVLIYISSAGLEVIARITAIQFVVLGTVVITLPLMLFNEIEPSNIMPIIGTDTVSDLSKSSFQLLPWMGESVIFFFLLGNVAAKKGLRRATIRGITIGLSLLFILIITSLAALGKNLVSKSTYPNFIMIQEINITDFLDRLDLIIVILWMPIILSKLALSLYCIHRAFFNRNGGETANIMITHLGLLLGVLAIILFDRNVVHLEFAFLTWPIIGLVLELFILIFVIILRFRTKSTE